MSELLNVDLAVARIVSDIRPVESENISIYDALGRVLANDIDAPLDLPIFANSSMDGYAVVSTDVEGASDVNPITLPVVMDIPAGYAPKTALKPGQAARIMTGAPIPQGADAVIPVENTDAHWGEAATNHQVVRVFQSVNPGANIRLPGEDVTKGQRIFTKGWVLRPQDIGMLAALGCAELSVYRRPKVAVLSSGDELVSIHDPLTPGKIRDSNSFILSNLVRQYGGEVFNFPIARDTKDSIRAMFDAAVAKKPDMIVTSAGVSVGAADLIKQLLSQMGKVDFWRINIRPGKPLAYGQLAGIPFFGLPGNPVSAMVTFDVFVRPALMKMIGRNSDVPIRQAKLKESVKSDGRRTYMRVKLEYNDDGELWASTTGTQSSGALMSMVLADGLLILPENITKTQIGDVFPVRLLKEV
ncbi:MAG: molybdopterin molybdenumtransferase MoeA [Chloroflexi bacterium]|nr:MAG: molybdopterin molybdenumtransferase MoeA [Chloroflexota bacterium]